MVMRILTAILAIVFLAGLPATALAQRRPRGVISGPSGPSGLSVIGDSRITSRYRDWQSYTSGVNDLPRSTPASGRPLTAQRCAALKTLTPRDLVTSFVPRTPGPYRDAMIKGEKAFREGRYREAKAIFEAAAPLAVAAPGSMLSLSRTDFTIAKGSYDSAAVYLLWAVEKFPELMYIRIEPGSFYGKPDDFKGALARLVAHAKAKPTDANAHFVLGYFMWRERDLSASLV